MSWVSIILLAAGAVAIYVPNTGSYDQYSRNGVQDPLRLGQNEQREYDQRKYGPKPYSADQYGLGKYSSGQSVPKIYGQQQNVREERQGQYVSGENVPQEYVQNNPQQYGPEQYRIDENIVRKYGLNNYQQGQYAPYSASPAIGATQNFEQFRRRFDHPGMGVYDSAAYLNHQNNVGVDEYNEDAAVAQRLVPDEAREPPSDNDFGMSNIEPYILDDLKIFAEPIFAVYKKGSTEPEKFELTDAVKILKSSNFDKSKKTMVYIHGFIEGLFSESIKDVVKTYLSNGGYNILIMDWHWYASPPYFLKAVPNVQKVGVRVARALLDMINSGLSIQNLHIVGHSLGGQMAGVVGRTIQKESGGAVILPRISALDPAFPGFYGIPNVQPLNEYDAQYVDVLHTDVGVYGAPVSTGTVDFWPNGGLPPQPGCITNVCSHQRSWWYWGGSVLNNATNYFNAVKSKSWWAFKNGEVDEYDPNVFMGLTCPAGLYGNYYLQTNDGLPYARGNEGISFVKLALHGALPPTPLLQPKEVIVPEHSFF